MTSRDLKELLKGLGLTENKAVFFSNKEDGKTFVFPSKETEKKLSIIKPTAFYVFNDQPYILFFDLTSSDSKEKEDEIHKQVWSFDQSPVIFIIKDGDIQIFNAFAYSKDSNSLEEIKLSPEERTERFSFWNIQSGTTWTWLQDTYYKNKIHKKRINQKLFENIKNVREKLTDKSEENYLSDDEANILILRLVFIRYLIDRKVKLEPDFIDGITILEKKKAFSGLIERPRKLNEFFESLNVKFNGVLFKDIKTNLSKLQAKSLALVFSGEKPDPGSLFADTDFYFEVFDFSIIPVEVISGIYESLIDDETRKLHSAVYTPSFLVEYILSNTIDVYFDKRENKKNAECKVYDPSVGSGIFLVQAFRRMVDREISITNEPKISKVRLREIAENNLFGTDINLQALKVTCFSIYIAILDYQDPKTILDNFHFPKLINENLFEANFFATTLPYNEIIKSKNVDFILGNPPWKNGSSDPDHVKYLKETKIDNCKLIDIVSDYQLAQSFILRSKDFSASQPQCALIVTSQAIYNSGAKHFRNTFLGNFNVNECFDLSAVRGLIFEGAANPAMILFFQYATDKNTTQNIVKHLSVKPNLFLRYFKSLIIEKSEIKRIKQEFFISHSWMFKVALYGGTLDYVLLKRLSSIEKKIKSLIDNKTVYGGDGIKLLTENARQKIIEKSIKSGKKSVKIEPFNDIRKIPIIETLQIKENYTKPDSENLPSESDLYVKSGNNINLYLGHRVLLKARPRNESDIVFSYVDCDSVFREKTLGISSRENYNVLKLFYSYVSTKLYSYFQFLTSSSWGTYYPEILQEEYLSFPFNAPSEEISNKLVAWVTDILSPIKEYYDAEFRAELPTVNSEIIDHINNEINKIFKIKGYEYDLIDYVLQVSRYQFQEGKRQQQKITRKVHDDKDVLDKYAKVFLQEFKGIYEDDYIHIDVYPLQHFVAMNFIFSKEKPKEKIRIVAGNEMATENQVFNALAQNISISQIAKDLYVQKDIKGFEEESFYIIKPNEYKCWHRAMAWYDVADVKERIQSAELERLKTV